MGDDYMDAPGHKNESIIGTRQERDAKLDEQYREEGWGLITDRALKRRVAPRDVESMAREVAQYAYEREQEEIGLTNKLASELEKSEQKIRKLESELDAKDFELKQAKNDRDLLSGKVDTFDKRVISLEHELQKRDATIDTLQNAAKLADRLRSEATGHLAALNLVKIELARERKKRYTTERENASARMQMAAVEEQLLSARSRTGNRRIPAGLYADAFKTWLEEMEDD